MPVVDEIEFTVGAGEAVAEVLRNLAAERAGWVNVRPIVEAADLPDPPVGLLAIFTKPIAPLPIGTWMAPVERRGTVRPARLGVMHPANTRVVPRLREAGVVAPSSWRLVQDNARRGVVVDVPADEDPMLVVTWLVGAIAELSPVPFGGNLRATVHR
jgi:hypothetical protein